MCFSSEIFKVPKPLLVSSLQHHPILLLSALLHLVQVLKVWALLTRDNMPRVPATGKSPTDQGDQADDAHL